MRNILLNHFIKKMIMNNEFKKLEQTRKRLSYYKNLLVDVEKKLDFKYSIFLHEKKMKIEHNIITLERYFQVIANTKF